MRHPFGGTTADFVEQIDQTGAVRVDAGVTCTFYPAQTTGAVITDLLDSGGNPVPSIAADAYGWIPPFSGPDGVTQLWVDSGGPNRQLMQATDAAARLAVLEGVFAQSATAPALATGGTITTASTGVSRVAPTGNVTGVILQPGTSVGQPVVVVNESAFTITFAAAGTSSVADGTADVIAALTARSFIWDSVTSKWYRKG